MWVLSSHVPREKGERVVVFVCRTRRRGSSCVGAAGVLSWGGGSVW